MAGTITKLAFQKRSQDRVSVFLDGRYAFGIPALEGAKLKKGQFLSDEEIARLQEANAAQRAYERALRFLAPRPRSEAEVRRRMVRWKTPPEVVEEIVDRLGRQGYLDDAEFVRYWVDNRERHKPRGPLALRQELRQKGVSGRLIDEALETIDFEDSAYRAGQMRLRRWESLPYKDFRKAAIGYLARRGFYYSVVSEVVEQLWRETRAGESDESEVSIE